MSNRPASPVTEDTKRLSTGSGRESVEKWMHAIGRVEGLSFLLLLFVAMPLKYVGDNPTLVHWLGPIHGGLFLLYCASVVVVARILKWPWLYVILAFVASVVPFGPFILEAWLRRAPRLNS